MQFYNCELRSKCVTSGTSRQTARNRFCQIGNFCPAGQLEAIFFERWAATRSQQPGYIVSQLVLVDSLRVECTLQPDEIVFETLVMPKDVKLIYIQVKLI